MSNSDDIEFNYEDQVYGLHSSLHTIMEESYDRDCINDVFDPYNTHEFKIQE